MFPSAFFFIYILRGNRYYILDFKLNWRKNFSENSRFVQSIKFNSHGIIFEILFLIVDGVSRRLRLSLNDLTQGSAYRCSNFYSF